MPLKFELGEAFQFDWSCEYAVIGGLRRRLEVAHVKLAASRVFHLVAYPMQSHEMLFDAHTRAFIAFGGVPRRGIYDNMKTAVDRSDAVKNVSSTHASKRCAVTICSSRSFATVLPVGKKASLRRMCRIVVGSCGRPQCDCTGLRWQHSMTGWPGMQSCVARHASSRMAELNVWPMYWSMSRDS